MDTSSWKQANRFLATARMYYKNTPRWVKVLGVVIMVGVMMMSLYIFTLSDERKISINHRVTDSLTTLSFMARRENPVPPPPAPLKPLITKAPLPDYNIPMSSMRVDDIHVCVAMSTLLDTGGTEQWFWSVVDSIYHKSPFVLHAVQVNDYWSHGAVKKIHSRRIKFNPTSRDMVEECDVIIQTGTSALRDELIL